MNDIFDTAKIEKFMKENGLSKTAFCGMCKIGNDSLKKIYNNNLDFSIVILFKIARVINIRVHEIFLPTKH